ncbi:MAG: TetR/AcrR family transcriptional regulator [Emcibacter sp.]|nr:TetR/AcrR family transcriptional regulator [Emcibacter sp.]
MLAENMDSPKTVKGGYSMKNGHQQQKYIVIQAALRLFHENGYDKVKISDIARAASVTSGEVEEYFPSKQEICHKVIDSHLENQAKLFEDINQNSNPRQRLSLYLDTIVDDTESLIRRGCPLTNLYFDVRRQEEQLSGHVVKLLQQRLNWISEQFVLIMKVKEVPDLAERLASAIHGICILAQVTGDENLIRHQVNQLKSWIRSM